MSKTIRITSTFPEKRERIFELLQKVETLKFIAKPYATFENVNSSDVLAWKVGEKFAFKFRLFGFINLGVHSIEVICP